MAPYEPQPDLSHLPLDKDTPEPKGNAMCAITCVDADLSHDVMSGESVTGVVHFLNQTPIDSHSKKHTVEVSAFSSESVAAKIVTEQIIDLQLTLTCVWEYELGE